MRKKTAYKIIICIFASLFFIPQAEAQHSALSEGEWWRVEITENGVYRLTGSELSGMTGCNMADIMVCGSVGGPLATTNGLPRPNDMEEMAVELHDNDGDGIFDSDDYILFYASGADSWEYTPDDGFHHIRHPYSNANYVFVSSKTGSHRRIASAEVLAQTNNISTSARSLSVHENDKVNTHRSGQIWVGERFTNSSGSEQTFSLPLNSTRCGIANVTYAIAAVSTAMCSFNVAVGGQSQNHSVGGSNPYRVNSIMIPAASGSTINTTIRFSASESMAVGYLDYVEVDAEVTLRVNSGVSAYSTYPTGSRQTYNVAGGTATTKVWDVTNYNNVTQMPTTLNNGMLTFTANNDMARHYVIFSANDASSPAAIQKITNQDIHGASLPDMVIVCHPNLKSAAERLASIHSIQDQMEVLVVTQNEVFNEFSSGQKDPIAIREMLRHFRNRAASEGGRSVSHLLLFGKGTYDNKDILGNGLPTVVTYQSLTSFDSEGSSMSTDDIFTYLDDGEGLVTGTTMDIAVGRLPAKSLEEATHLVNKIENYITKKDLVLNDIRGDWRNSVALLSDDADPSCPGDTAFTVSSEYVSKNILANHPQMTIDKIYADAYMQQSGADGSFYPDVNNALKKRMDYGCLLLNYIGHGSAQYIGTERFMMKSNISSYQNHNQLTYFVTSTCTFGRHDDPTETCGAEEFILADGGGIACLAATRPISHVQEVNNDMVLFALDAENTIGEAVRKAKNRRYTTQSLTLLGDPAIKLSIPSNRAVVTKINGVDVDTMRNDTALVLSTVRIEGEIRDNNGTLVSDFDGDIYPEVFDRARESQTLANDNEGCEVKFLQQNSIIYRGHAAVSEGRFSFQFTVPRDVPYRFDFSRISLYAKTASEDASGAYTNLMLGGYDDNADLREVRPDMQLYMNDTCFRNGGITDANPTLLVMLFDSVGINAVGSGLGHDMTAVLDGNTNNTIILNDLYETDIEDEHRGTVRYNLTGLSKGRHTVTVRIWNIFNYSNSKTISFYVPSEDGTTTEFVAYPTPATSHIKISMEHNIKGAVNSAMLYIYDMQGRLVRSFTPSVSTENYVVGPVDWKLDTSSGHRVSPGIYIARFELTTIDGEIIREQGKVVVR